MYKFLSLVLTALASMIVAGSAIAQTSATPDGQTIGHAYVYLLGPARAGGGVALADIAVRARLWRMRRGLRLPC